MTTHPKREYTRSEIEQQIEHLRNGYGAFLSRADCAEMLEQLLASQFAAQKRDGDEAWKTIETAPKDRHILLYGEVDGGNRSCDKTVVGAIWVNGGEPSDIFGEEGGWMVSFTDDCIAAVVDPTHWQEKPLPPSPDQDREVSP
jgi:hypothetical protein